MSNRFRDFTAVPSVSFTVPSVFYNPSRWQAAAVPGGLAWRRRQCGGGETRSEMARMAATMEHDEDAEKLKLGPGVLLSHHAICARHTESTLCLRIQTSTMPTRY